MCCVLIFYLPPPRRILDSVETVRVQPESRKRMSCQGFVIRVPKAVLENNFKFQDRDGVILYHPMAKIVGTTQADLVAVECRAWSTRVHLLWLAPRRKKRATSSVFMLLRISPYT
jgi:hypothetical protein